MELTTPPITPTPSPDRLSPPESPRSSSSSEKKVLFADSLRPFIDLLNRQAVALSMAVLVAVKVLEALFFKWMSCVYKILCDSIDKLAFGRTTDELKTEVVAAHAKHEEHVVKWIALKDKIQDPAQFIQNLKELKELKQEIRNNLDKLRTGSPESGPYSIADLILFYLPEDPIAHTLRDTLKQEEALVISLEDFLTANLPSTLKIFEQFMRTAWAEGEEGENRKTEILSTWRDLTSQFSDSVRTTHRSMLETMEQSIRSTLKMEIEKEDILPPKEVSAPSCKVKNKGQNTCYLASVVQMICAVPSLYQQIAHPIPVPASRSRAEEYEKKLAIQQAFLKLVSSSTEKSYGENENYFLYSQNLLHNLREAIFNSGFNKTEFNTGNIGRQLDAASVLELFSTLFFENCSFNMRHVIRVDQYPGMKIQGPSEMNRILQIELDENKHAYDLKELMDSWFKEKVGGGELILNSTEQNIQWTNSSCTTHFNGEVVNQHTIQYSLDQFPPVLLTHFKRFKGFEITEEDGTKKYEKMKIGDSIELTQDGLFSFSMSGLPDTIYKLKSFVMHAGNSVDGGHYTSYVEIQGKYYFCDDNNSGMPNCYREVNQAEFLAASKQAYLCVWERFPFQA